MSPQPSSAPADNNNTANGCMEQEPVVTSLEQPLEDPLEAEALRNQQIWAECARDAYKGIPQSKYERYHVPVDHLEGDRATRINICSVQRPHMRGLHCAWISFFLAFTIWFAPAPLLKEIQQDLNLSKAEVWTSSIANDCAAIFMRVIMGPICDNHGARMPMAIVLVVAAIPTATVGLVHSSAGLAIVRFFIGIAGSSFVMAQFWASRMFSREIAGTANGIVGGWGNLGGAFTQLFIGAILFPAFTDYYDGDSERSWRTICIIPASLAFTFGLILPFISDDAPVGNYSEMKKSGTMDRVFFTTSLRQGATKNTWILFVQYACSFGVELVMYNAAVLYYTSEFGISTEEASTYGFLYGSMNFFARGLGGFISDQLNIKFGMRGRLWLQTILLVLEGITITIFSFTRTLAVALVVMCIFSIFTQAAEGAIYGVVPYVSKLYTGSVAGFVGSGGNVGSVVYGFGFRSLPYDQAFLMMGAIVIASSFLSFLIDIPCHAGLISGEDNHAVIQARERYIRRLELERRAGAGETVDGIEAHTGESAGQEEDQKDITVPEDLKSSLAIEDGNRETVES
jgi:NNP family nitrate/nitrite transporter-like MFS transporter